MIWEVVRGQKRWKPVEVLLGQTLETLYQEKQWKKQEIEGSNWSIDFTNPDEV